MRKLLKMLVLALLINIPIISFAVDEIDFTNIGDCHINGIAKDPKAIPARNQIRFFIIGGFYPYFAFRDIPTTAMLECLFPNEKISVKELFDPLKKYTIPTSGANDVSLIGVMYWIDHRLSVISIYGLPFPAFKLEKGKVPNQTLLFLKNLEQDEYINRKLYTVTQCPFVNTTSTIQTRK